MYPDKAKMKKQMSYADAKHIAYVALAGDNEIAEGKVTLKDMTSGKQELMGIDEIIDTINQQ